ncbi:phosphoglycerate mutase-like protein 4 [Tanacetum coccineum]|uniref:Phosphoglycerate mutase-like protein 4 n=1 Tax=Tanacetum coccineum TaxID=301880 RepID=A0ABQ5GTK6_9ASTR
MATATHSSDGEEVDYIDGSVTEIVIVRHGETEWNADRRIQGHLDIDLNDVGRQQAVAVAERLSKEPKISAIYSSDLKRALETAKTIASKCGGLQVIQEPNLRERHLGDLQGVVYGDAPTLKTKAYEALQSHGMDVEIPGGGESLNQLSRRCTASLQTIASKHRGERVVVVTHGGVIRALHERASTGKRHRAGRILNVSVNVLHLTDTEKWVIKSWGDVSHLNGAGYLDSGFGGDRTSG